MKISHQHKTIELINDENYTPFSTDNPFPYSRVYIAEDIRERGFQVVSKIGIIIRDVSDPDKVLCAAIICETGGATSIGEQTQIIEGQNLVVCICNMVYCLNIHTLDLQWKTKADTITCFCIHKFGQGLITHGELELTKLDFNGLIEWQFSAREIFVTPNDQPAFRIEGECAIVQDWSGYEYVIDANGKPITETKIGH